MRITPNKAVEEALARLKKAGYQACLVGGCVRDEILKIAPHDLDVATDALPDAVKRVFAKEKLILAGEKHGTVAPIIFNEAVEITTFRVDGSYQDGRRPDQVNFTKNITEDLARRDFTINAMAYDAESGLIDPFGGALDCQNQIIRAVGDASARFSEDGLRILRGLRFAARFGFKIEESTARAMHELKNRLLLISRERIAAELSGLLRGEHAALVLTEFSDILWVVLPELAPLQNCPQNSVYHCYDVFEHTMKTLQYIAPRTDRLTLAALLHDAGKPAARSRDGEGFDHFTGHQAIGAEIARRVMLSLKMPAALTKDVCLLVTHHDDAADEKSIARLLNAVGETLFDDLIALKRADLLAHAPHARQAAYALPDLITRKNELLKDGICYRVSGLKLNGRDLKALGLKGPHIGKMLETLLAAVLDGKIKNERGALTEAVRSAQTNGL